MTTYYVGSGGNDANAGTSWGARKLTLNGAEDIPVAAGDTVYVAPGVYRELLTCDVSGSSGNPITYIADVTGQNTDGVGGIVRITGSDNDTTGTRVNAITATARDYRTFRGFFIDTTTDNTVVITNCDYFIVEDCEIQPQTATSKHSIYVSSTSTYVTIRRCKIYGAQGNGRAVAFTHSSVVDNTAHLVENCVFPGGGPYDVLITRIGGITFKNCLFIGGTDGIYIDTAITVGQTISVNNCIFCYIRNNALRGTVSGEIVEDYNNIFACGTARSNTATGANSVSYPPLFQPQIYYSGLRLPTPALGELSEWSQVRAIAGSSEATDDHFGITRPTTSAKKSWGAVQYGQEDRETSTVDAGSVSLKLADAGYRQFIIPVGNVSTTFTVKCYREADYTGTNPQIIIKQPGVADNTTTDAGSASAWNTLSVTLTPAASPDYVIVELRSNNTATSGNYDVFFDTFTAAAALDPNGMEYWIADRMPLPQLAETEVAGGGLLTHPGMAGGING